MKIELDNIVLSDEHPTDYCLLNKDYACLIIGPEKVTVKIDELIEALKLMKLRS